MAINIVDMLKSQISSQIAGQVGKQFGESESATKSGLEVMIPAVLGGLLGQVSKPGGAQKLDKTLTEGGFDGSMLDNLSGMFGGGASQASAGKGGDLISMIFGDKVSMLAPIVMKMTGMKSTSIMSMLTMLAPLVMSFLGKQKATMRLDADGLANLLTSQKDSIVAAMPAGMADTLNISKLGIASPAASAPRSRPSQPVAQSDSGLGKVLVPLAILAALGFAAYQFMKGGAPIVPADDTVIVDTPDAGMPQTPAIVEDKKESAAETVTKTLGGLKLPGMAAMPDLGGMFKKVTGSFDSIKDIDSAKAALPELQAANDRLKTVTSGFSAMPEAVRVKMTETLKTMLPDLQSTIDKVMAIPGVKAILQPVVDSMMEKFKTIVG